MKSEDKANQLLDEMYNTENCHKKHTPNNMYCDCSEINRFQSVQCAIIAVNLILEEYCNDMSFDPSAHYWLEVKQHLEEML